MTALFFKMHTVLNISTDCLFCYYSHNINQSRHDIKPHWKGECIHHAGTPILLNGLIRRDCCLSVAYILEYILLVSARHINSKNVGFVHTAVILRFAVPDVPSTPHQLSGQNCTWSKLTNVRKFVMLKILSRVQFAYYSMTHWQKLD